MTTEKENLLNLLREWSAKENGADDSFHIGSWDLKEEIKLGNAPLYLNGAGFREWKGRPAYLVALYLPEFTNRYDTAKALLGPRRTELIVCEDLLTEEFIASLKDSIVQNVNETAQHFIANELGELTQVMRDLHELKSGDTIHFDWIPGKGTFITYNGEVIASPIRGKALNDAVLSIWIGEKPLDEALKASLLGL
jgi:hypothetical protein